MSQLKESNVVMLSTEKANEGLFISKTSSKLWNGQIDINFDIPQHLYIVSPTEKIKKEDWAYDVISKVIQRAQFSIDYAQDTWFKIIASTDPTLNLPSLSQTFIQKYISEYNKGNIITKVNVEYCDWFKKESNDNVSRTVFVHPKLREDETIIITKIEPKVYTEEDMISFANYIRNEDLGEACDDNFKTWIKQYKQ